jgi:hypothetical protein
MKVPLKVKIFMWYLLRDVILTKDNLAKRNWRDSLKCCFCHYDENIKHLFFQCKLTRSIWSDNLIAFILYPSQCGTYFQQMDHRDRVLIWMGAVALLWSLWVYGYVETRRYPARCCGN